MSEGVFPAATLVLGQDGNFYGANQYAGPGGNGGLYKITPAGSLTVLHGFTGTDGSGPQGRLLRAADGSFYGTTNSGGDSGAGTVFKLAADGSYTLLHSFNGADEGNQPSELVQGADGALYGATLLGGANNYGTVYRITTQGAYAIVHSFNRQDGAYPLSGLTSAADGTLYGTTTAIDLPNGQTGGGAIYAITPQGAFQLAAAFPPVGSGSSPRDAMVLGADGSLYGTTAFGGSSDDGTIFKYVPGSAAPQILYQFGGTDGATPGPLSLKSDGGLYGTTYRGGANNYGSVYKFDPNSSTLVTLYSFNSTDGAYPTGGVVESGGVLYGTTTIGGDADGDGIVFSLLSPAPPAVNITANPAAVLIGQYTQLSWGSTGAVSCAATGGWSSDPGLSGSRSVRVMHPGANSYTLSCTNQNGTSTQTATVTGTLPDVSFVTAAEPTTKGNLPDGSTTRITVQLSAAIPFDVTVPFSLGGTDPHHFYTISPVGSLTIAADATSASITAHVKVPAWLQCNRTITFTLGTPGNAVLGAIIRNTLTVHNYGPLPCIGR